MAVSVSANLPTLYEYYTAGGIKAGLSDKKPYFTLNDRNITIYSGAFHYFRVPRAYWRDRLRKMKAAGLNTVETYTPWSFHEPESGVFDFGKGGSDFEDFLHLDEFLKTAKEEDLFAIVRAGPYVDTELDFGGLPGWLMGKVNSVRNSKDTHFLTYVKRFFNVLLPILAALQFQKGGPVIMYQVENEYGSTNLQDHVYLNTLKQMYLDHGIKELLCTSDPPRNERKGAIDGVLQTANFNGDPKTMLDWLNRLQKGKPSMAMESYTGWFDHWMDSHHHTSTNDYKNKLQQILAYPASVNMYMFIGVFDFGKGGSDMEDFLHLEEFLKTAKEEDLFAIVRGGPYVDTELDFGGLPGWLMGKVNSVRNSRDSNFLTYVKRFFNVLLPILAALQFQKGGPVIMYQVENEYGSTNLQDHVYLNALKQMYLDHGIKELLCTSDPPRNERKGAIDGVLQTANFNGDPKTMLDWLNRLQKDKPSMAMESYTGWFDHWMDNHHHRSTNEYKNKLQQILAYPASVNMYMFIGVFDFGEGGSDMEDFLHLEEFLKTAKEEDLFAIVRGGPYVDTELDFGGLPGWLMGNVNSVRNSRDSNFLTYVKRFFNVLLPILAALQFQKGGPVIIYQVENEYGSTNLQDHEYLNALKQIYLDHGIKELLCTSDPPRNERKGAIDGVLQTANFNGDPKTMLDWLNRLQKNKPSMAMESYTGWFDHWMDNHHHRSTNEYKNKLQQILAYPASVNMYMFIGMFDFGEGGSDMEDFLHLEDFLKTAKEEDLFAIVRAGPYVDTELDFGGLPGWLMGKVNSVRNSKDSNFLTYVKRFFNVLLPIIAALQFQNGGPVIMYQVENEYGSTNLQDHVYLNALKQMYLDHGIKELLCTSDPPRNERKGAIDGVLQTANFNGDPKTMLDWLNRLQTGKPSMAMESYTGSFDHWTDNHHHKTTSEYKQKLQEILEYPASVNMYMFIGSTTFGFMNGATLSGRNTSGLLPDTTSYDYDSPITEYGDYTMKYYAVREVINAHNKVKTRTVNPPARHLPIAYPPVKPSGQILLSTAINNLKNKKNSAEIIPMEQAGQSYGYIVYRKTGLTIPANAVLKISGYVKDSVLVLLNGKLISPVPKTEKDIDGFGFWKLENPSIVLSRTALKDATLDLVVENLGRNTRAVLFYKGLTDPVYINNVKITNWVIAPLEFKKSWNNALSGWHSVATRTDTSALYKFSLNLSNPEDTFLDMRKWTRGIVIVNGFVLGRYFFVGPQQTLYLPAPLLKKGVNEIIVFEHYNAPDSLQFSKDPIFGKA